MLKLTASPVWHNLPHAPAPGTLIGHRDALQDGQVLLHQVFSESDVAQQNPFPILLLRSGQDIKAYANRCAHFGVPLAAKQEHMRFVPHVSLSCNVHYARYRWSDGVCDRGDCLGESLSAIPLVVDARGAIRIAPNPPETSTAPTPPAAPISPISRPA
jgi:nitrite reductase/ring-hydroxylating ferredoxin subunit